MAFTIKCTECGNEQVFTEGMFRSTDKIELEVDISQREVNHITIYCESDKCGNWIDIKY